MPKPTTKSIRTKRDLPGPAQWDDNFHQIDEPGFHAVESRNRLLSVTCVGIVAIANNLKLIDACSPNGEVWYELTGTNITNGNIGLISNDTGYYPINPKSRRVSPEHMEHYHIVAGQASCSGYYRYTRFDGEMVAAAIKIFNSRIGD